MIREVQTEYVNCPKTNNIDEVGALASTATTVRFIEGFSFAPNLSVGYNGNKSYPYFDKNSGYIQTQKGHVRECSLEQQTRSSSIELGMG